MAAELARVEEIFAEALEKADLAQRADFLDSACNGDNALRERVEALLAAHANAGSFLGLTASESTVIFTPLSERPGTTIGHYKLLEQIGEGGFGVVFMAEQERPVRRRVALKIIKAGMDTRQVVARFEAERQALAMMEHPNIARVFDGGATETGRPYFVMELVRGVPVTEYCDESRLTINERLRLFQSVCSALQHAHQKGIIHRDLKPSNVLVTMHDDKAAPKVIDFGVAKATQGRLTERTLFTEFRAMIGTPNYMSPEQAHMSGLDVDTRSDVYSLGVLLYELLTGTTPIDTKQIGQATYDDLRRMICEQEPPKPSTRLSALSAEQRTTLARQRHCELEQLSIGLRSELDWIVMKCLEKDRSRRYESASALAGDLERYLSNEPVGACPPSPLYRLKKFVRRNRVGVLAGSTIAVALLVSMAMTMIGLVQARREAERADSAAVRAIAISNFLQEMLQSADPDQSKGQQYTVRQLLDEFSAGLTDQFVSEPAVEADIRKTIGLAYRRLDPNKAEQHLGRAMEIRCRLVGDKHEEFADSLVDYASVVLEQARRDDAENHVRQALAIYRDQGTIGKRPIRALQILQIVLTSKERASEIEAVVDQTIAMANQSPNEQFPEIANIYHGLIAAKINEEAYSEAEALARKCVELHLQLQGPNHPETGWGYHHLGRALSYRHKYGEAFAALRKAAEIFRKSLPQVNHGSASNIDALTYALYSASKSNQLPVLFDSPVKLEEFRKLYIESLPEELDLFQSGSCVVAQSVESGLEILIDVHSRLQKSFSSMGDSQRANEIANQIPVLQAELEAIRQKVTEQVTKQMASVASSLLKSESPDTRSLCRFTWFICNLDDPALCNPKLAVELATRAVQLGPNDGMNWNCLGIAEYCAGRWQSSVDAFSKAASLSGPDGPADLYYRAMAHGQLGQQDEAQLWLRKAIEWKDRHEPHDHLIRRIHNEAAELIGTTEPEPTASNHP